MKFIHLADVHLADSFNFDKTLSKKIREASWQSLSNILQSNKDVDFALIAGDLFERAYFTASDFKRLFKIFEDFSKDIYYVSGNHDYFDSYNSIFLENSPENFHVFGSENLEVFEKDKLRVYGISYKDRIFSKDLDLAIKLDDEFFNIFLIHGDVDREESNYFSLNSKIMTETNFDYIAMGHIHKAHSLNNIYYPGSVEPHDFTDIYDYGYIRYDDGKVNFFDSSILKFYDFKLDFRDFDNEEDLLSYINHKLKNKKNIVRIEISSNKDIDQKFIRNNIDAIYKEIHIKEKKDLSYMISLFPNSLLSLYAKKFDSPKNEIENLALEMGLDAILRSKDD
ncbi:exonuclease SbcCD, D subunit [Anaerococcus prevotii]|uniref:Metallophosphoesterase n=1 Tax=Anaerococcus prevotii (strain ATCC 9321 / DSM 20548 / JCM 6508 / NCTC 11806 / PC1) TaxID=525919 RepID=C7RH43_ANAPD|nr:metallophosphoesterase [Anaerococcus prevotii]ACV28804.1 metallophosphoesterase [Anaerococcus prevotii DSM 20548]SUU94479.1 exonuclease SbcCD, D subunit [Anaerococcus prevotii]